MNRPRVVRLLRIGWSAGCVIACALLIVLWVRSYFWADQIIHQDSNANFIAVTSGDGRLLLGESSDPALGTFFGPGWNRRHCEWSRAGSIPMFPASVPLSPRGRIFGWPVFSNDAFVAATPGARYYQLIEPYWLLLLTVIGFGLAPWFRWRFSLRTLLIVTTLVAIVLGVIVWTR